MIVFVIPMKYGIYWLSSETCDKAGQILGQGPMLPILLILFTVSISSTR